MVCCGREMSWGFTRVVCDRMVVPHPQRDSGVEKKLNLQGRMGHHLRLQTGGEHDSAETHGSYKSPGGMRSERKMPSIHRNDRRGSPFPILFGRKNPELKSLG